MKSLQKLLAILLAVSMCLVLLAACAKDSKDADDTEQPSDSTQTPNDETPDDAETPSDEEEMELTEITVAILDMQGKNGEASDKIEAAINAITEPSIGVTVNLQYFDFGNYATQVSLMITGGETLDLINNVPISGITFNNMYANAQLMDISSYLEQDYASGIMDVVGDYIGAYSFDGGIYGIPTYRIYATNQYLIMRKDILDDLGMTEIAQNAKTWTEIEGIFDAVLANTDLYPIGGQKYIAPTNTFIVLGSDDFADNQVWDNLSDSTGIVYTDNEGNVSSSYEQPGWVASMERLADWYGKGYIWPDSITNDDTSDNIVKQGVIFSKLDNSEVGVEVAKEETTGYPVVCNNLCTGMVTNARLVGFGLVVPVTSQEPEAAIKFANALYTSSELMDIITWGIEGEDFVRLDSGEITYPEGVTTDSVEYHNADYLLGNQFLASPWLGNGGDFRAVSEEVNNSAPVSPYLGFALDVSELGDEIAALSSVIDEFRPNLTCGLYTEDLYNDFIAKLDTAGMQTYLDSCQTQLSDWMAAQ